MIDFKFLDAALRHLFTSDSWNRANSDLPQFDKDQNKLLYEAYLKMEKDGYVYSKVVANTKTFYISFDGILFVQESGGMPYTEKKKKEKLKYYWDIAKIVSVAINAAIVLFYTIMAYYKN